MSRPIVLIPVAAILAVVLFHAWATRTDGEREDGPGALFGFCSMCGGPMWPGGQPSIPPELPAPKNRAWVDGLRQALALEKLSRAQYEHDSVAYRARMPYGMIIPQEENHIAWLGRLFSAYGIAGDARVPDIRKTSSLAEAYGLGITLEQDLTARYEELVPGAEDRSSREVIDAVLLQTRMHSAMFTHALRMGAMGQGR